MYLFNVIIFLIFCHYTLANSPVELPSTPIPFYKSENPGVKEQLKYPAVNGPHIQNSRVDLNGHQNFYGAQQIFYFFDHPNEKVVQVQQNSVELPNGYTITPGIGAHKLHSTKKNWNEARNACINEGAHLAVMNSAKEEEVLQSLRKNNNFDSVWLGLHDQFQEGDWVTVLDVPLKENGYVGWTGLIPNNPDNYGGNQNCARLTNGGMDDIQCSNPFAFLCEIPLKSLDRNNIDKPRDDKEILTNIDVRAN